MEINTKENESIWSIFNTEEELKKINLAQINLNYQGISEIYIPNENEKSESYYGHFCLKGIIIYVLQKLDQV